MVHLPNYWQGPFLLPLVINISVNPQGHCAAYKNKKPRFFKRGLKTLNQTAFYMPLASAIKALESEMVGTNALVCAL